MASVPGTREIASAQRSGLDVLIWVMLSTYLLVDTVSGIVTGSSGGIAPLSQAWKGGILLLIYLRMLHAKTAEGFLLLLMTALLIAGPFVRLMLNGNTESFVEESVMALKLLMPSAVLIYGIVCAAEDPELLGNWPRRALWLATATIAGNVLVGLAGYGFTSYGTRESGGIGSIGFFQAGNEVGAAFAVVCGFALLETWRHRRALYLPLVILVFAFGAAIATKAAIASSVVLSLVIPVAHQLVSGRRFPPALIAGLIVGAIAIAAALSQIWTLLENIGLSDRIRQAFEERGWLGILLSGRDLFLADAAKHVVSGAGWITAFFGVGPHFFDAAGVKTTLEMDFFDLYFWFGLPGLAYGLIFCGLLIVATRRSMQLGNRPQAMVVGVLNILLIVLSFIAGHVLFGGSAGIVWSLLNAAAMAERGP